MVNAPNTMLHPLRHVAIIMDGNNRWAKERGLKGIVGHERGVERIRDAMDSCARHDIRFLTVFAFSTENWNRPPGEVRGLMSLFATYLKKEMVEFKQRNIRLRVIGDRSRFSDRLRKLILDAENRTIHGHTTLTLAVDYGGRWDIAQAARAMAVEVQKGAMTPAEINEESLGQRLCLSDMPAPDLCIRTAGEQRISNFLLWQLAYAELYFPAIYWPDFDSDAFEQAVKEYYGRQRRFGMTSEQMKAAQSGEAHLA